MRKPRWSARAAGIELHESLTAPPLRADHDLAIDGVLGLGLARAPHDWSLAAIHALNACGAPVLAIDVPSGLDADRGVVPGGEGTAVRARWTLTLLGLKPGLFTAQGRDHAGEVWLDELSCQPCEGAGSPDAHEHAPAARLLTDSRALWPHRAHAQHKGSFGDVWVVGGAPGMTGALLLAARAALVAGAGRVLAVPLDPGFGALDPQHPELMLRPRETLAAAVLESATVVCGCGGGDAVRALLPTLLSRAGRLLLDADALNAIAADASLTPLLHARGQRARPTILTPHPLEAARLLGRDAAQVQADRLAAARELTARCRALVVLKGSGTVIAAPNALPWINASGGPALASAGTGDVLAGWIGGLWSQGLEPIDAARLGVHSHGAVADGEQPAKRALQAGSLIRALRDCRAEEISSAPR